MTSELATEGFAPEEIAACPYEVKSSDPFESFQVDHILAIMNGGNEWEINNLQVLCPDCHKIKTKTDLKRSKALFSEVKA